jgi:hypothetical protein
MDYELSEEAGSQMCISKSFFYSIDGLYLRGWEETATECFLLAIEALTKCEMEAVDWELVRVFLSFELRLSFWTVESTDSTWV